MHVFGLRRAATIGIAGLGLLASAAPAAAATSTSAKPVGRALSGSFRPLAHRPGSYRITLHGIDRDVLTRGSTPTKPTKPGKPGKPKKPPTAVITLPHGKRRHDAVAMEIERPHYSAQRRTLSFVGQVLPAAALSESPDLSSLQGRIDQSLPPQFGPAQVFVDTSQPGPAQPAPEEPTTGCQGGGTGCPSAPQASNANQETLQYDGEIVQTVTVPEGIHAVSFSAIGGGGGSYDFDGDTETVGGDVSGMIEVGPGEELLISVGGAGQDTYNGTGGKDARGGWGGWGAGGGDGPSTDGDVHTGGAGGGGATTIDLRTPAGVVTHEVIAGGGGGVGGYGVDQGGGGGQGGPADNGNGQPGYTSNGGAGGKQGILTTLSGGFGQPTGGTSGNGGGGGGGGALMTAANILVIMPGGGQGGFSGRKGYGGGGGAAGASGANPQNVLGLTVESAEAKFGGKNGQVTLHWLT